MKKVIEILKRIHDEADHIQNTDTRSAQVIQKDCQSIKRLAKKALKQLSQNHCCCTGCHTSLWEKESVTREYVSKNTDNPSSYGRGHYDKNGDYEPDTGPSYPLVSHDLVDGSDTCTHCGAIVG